MNKKPKNTLIIIIVVAVFALYSFGLYTIASNPTAMISAKSNDKYLSRFIENYNNLKENWYYFGSEEDVINAATEAMTTSAKDDHYTEYINSEHAKEYFESMDSDYVGLGVAFLRSKTYPIVSRVFTGSPADLAGIKVGDALIKVNNKSLKGLNSEKVRQIVVGKENEKRAITIERDNKEKVVNVVLKALDSSVSYEIIDNNGYLNFNEFSKTSPKKIKEALDYFSKKNVSKVIVDMRDNPGGYLDSLQKIADMFVDANKVVIGTKDKSGRVQKYKTVEPGHYDKEIVILANHNSASASEALIACLNENNNIPILGETTYGKGIMQEFFEYDDHGFLKYTNGEWLTPKGNAINKKGIAPTVPIKDSSIFEAADLLYDFTNTIKYDSVSPALVSFQRALKALGYKIDRTDGYYSSGTKKVIEQFKKDFNIVETDLGDKTQNKIVQQILTEKNKRSNDNVLLAALKYHKK